MALTTIDRVKDWADPQMGSASDAALQAAIESASKWIVAVSGQEFERASRVLRLHGSDAVVERTRLYLPRKYAPYIHLAPDLITLKEDGASLTIGEDPAASPAPDVVIVGANDTGRCWLQRECAWGTGTANVEVTCKTGYTTSPWAIPAEIVSLANEVAILMFRAGMTVGTTSVSAAGHAVSIARDLSPSSRSILQLLQV